MLSITTFWTFLRELSTRCHTALGTKHPRGILTKVLASAGVVLFLEALDTGSRQYLASPRYTGNEHRGIARQA